MPSKAFWQERYRQSETGWDIGHISTPLKTYIDGLQNKHLKILIPGAGFGHEAVYLHKQGFHKADVVDFVKMPLDKIQAQLPNLEKDRLICGDFFKMSGQYDLVLEQTFFCALDPNLRESYVLKMAELLKPSGKLAGVLFDFPLDSGPPFGGSHQEYKALFEPYFDICTMDRCYNSINKRAGRELFVIFQRKD